CRERCRPDSRNLDNRDTGERARAALPGFHRLIVTVSLSPLSRTAAKDGRPSGRGHMARRKSGAPTFATTRTGDGPPVVLIHGIGHRRQAWDPVVGAVAAHRKVIAVDLPGFGESPGLPDDMSYDMPTTMENFSKLFADLGLDRPHVVGNSLGGAIALELGAV